MSACVSGHGEYSSHTHGDLKSDPRTYYTCIHCGAFDEDGVFEELVDRQTREAKLRAQIKELEGILEDYGIDLVDCRPALFSAIHGIEGVS